MKAIKFHRRMHQFFGLLLFLSAMLFINLKLSNLINTYNNPIIVGNQSSINFYTNVKVSLKTETSDKQHITCVIPNLNPYDANVKSYLKPPPDINCEKSFPLLFNSTLQSTIIPAKDYAYFQSKGYGSCCYRTVTRNANADNPDDSKLKSKKCYPINLTSETQIPAKHEFIIIYCRKNESDNLQMVDIHAFVPLKPKSMGSEKMTGTKDNFNIVVFGMDSMSRMNFLRTMNQSYHFLMDQLNAVEMVGYNKVGEATYQCMIPFLTSKTSEEFDRECPQRNISFDNCDFIWKNYSTQGYYTSFVEDYPDWVIFNYDGKPGFIRQPTDYYPRSLFLTADKISSNNIEIPACYGPRLSFQILLNYMEKFVYTMSENGKSFFQYIWSNSLAHDHIHTAALGDIHLLNSLKWLKGSGYLNKTIFIILSDHGNRVDGIRESAQGQYEDQLPFAFLLLPDSFKKRYAKAYQNLVNNRKRLTTSFDFHETLRDILHLGNIEEASLSRREHELLSGEKESTSKLPRGISLFLPISRSRTCEMASIEKNYCACRKMRMLSVTSPVIRTVAKVAVDHINLNELSVFEKNEDCAYLMLSKVTMAQQAVDDTKDKEMYLVNFETKPGRAQFEALVRRRNQFAPWKVRGKIARTNLYGNQSHCVKEKAVKYFCYCKDLLIKKNTK